MTPETIGDYRLLGKIGAGGMGEVFKALDSVDREVAIKFLRADLAENPELLERFRKEAKVLGSLHHPNIAVLYNFGRHENRWFMVMEFAHGQPLDDILRNNTSGLSFEWSMFLIRQALVAMKHAHEQGIVHRDIKPANMMVSNRAALKVLDFGIARVLGSARVTRLGAAVGTASYMSPEQVLAGDADERSDIYSLAVVLYEMLTGNPPFQGEREFEVMTAQVNQTPPPLRDLLPGLADNVVAAVMKGLSKKPEDRFQSADDFLAALGRLPFQVPATETPAGLDLQVGVSKTVPMGEVPTVKPSKSAGASPVPPTRMANTDDDIPQVDPKVFVPSDADTDVTTNEQPSRKARIQVRQEHRPRKTVALVLGLLAAGLAGVYFWKVSPTMTADAAKARDLVAQSRQALERNKILAPFGDNAVEYLQQARKIVGDESQVVNLAEELLASRLNRATEALQRGEFATARAYRNDAHQVQAKFELNDRQVVALDNAIKAAEEKLEAERREQLERVRRQEEIANLIKATDKAIAAGEITQPKDASAVLYLQRLQEKAADAAQIKRLAAAAVTASISKADSFLRVDDLQTAIGIRDEAYTISDQFKLGRDALKGLEGRIEKETRQQERLVQQLTDAAALEGRKQAMLQAGRNALQEGKLTKPEGGSAVDYAQQVMELDPDNRQAHKLVEQVLDKMVASADSEIGKKNLDAAREIVDEVTPLAKQYDLKLKKLDKVSQKLAELRARQAAAEAEVERKLSDLAKRAEAAVQGDEISQTQVHDALSAAGEMLKLKADSEQAYDIIATAVAKLRGNVERYLAQGNLTSADRDYKALLELTERFGLEREEGDELGRKLAAEKDRVAAEEARLQQQLQEKAAEEQRKAAELQQFIQKAQTAVAEKRLLMPEDDSAVHWLERVRESDPQAPVIGKLAGDIVTGVLASAKAAGTAANFEQAKATVNKAQELIARYGLQNRTVDEVSLFIANAEQKRVAEERKRAEEAAARQAQSAQQVNKEAEALNKILDSVHKALASGRPFEPARDNALALAETAVKKFPQSEDAKAVLKEVLQQSVASARESLASGKLDRALLLQRTAVQASQRHAIELPELADLNSTIESEKRDRETAARMTKDKEREAQLQKQQAEAQARKARIADLVARGRDALTNDRLTSPTADNAVDYAGEALKLDRQNRDALQILENVVGALVDRGDEAITKKAIADARDSFRTAEGIARRYGLPQAPLRRLGAKIAVASERPRPTVEVRLEPTAKPSAVPSPAPVQRAEIRLEPTDVSQRSPMQPSPVPTSTARRSQSGEGGNTFVPPSF